MGRIRLTASRRVDSLSIQNMQRQSRGTYPLDI